VAPQHPSMSLKLAFPTATTLVRSSARFTIHRSASAPICHRCAALRGLSTTSTLLKKGGGKQEQKRTVEINSAKSAGSDDAHDFSGFQHEIDKATDYLKSELSKLRAGGLDLEAIEALRVNLGTSGGAKGGGSKKDGPRSGGKGKSDTVKLGDVAQVVPRGRIVVIMVGEKEVKLLFMHHCGHWQSHISIRGHALALENRSRADSKQHMKPISSALQSSSMNLQPQTPSPTAPTPINLTSTTQLEIHIPVPPTTTASRQSASAVATQKGEAALFALNQARSAEKKRLRALHLARKVGPDDLRRTEKEMEKLNKDSQAVMENFIRERKKTLEGG